MDKAAKGEFGKLQKTIDKGFTAVADDVSSMDKKFTRHFLNSEGRLTSIEQEIKSIRRDLHLLHDKVGNIEGYGKEIDHGLERIVRIEKHLGIRSSA